MLVKADMAPRRPLTRAAALRALLGLGWSASTSSARRRVDASSSAGEGLRAVRLRLAVLLARGMLLWRELAVLRGG